MEWLLMSKMIKESANKILLTQNLFKNSSIIDELQIQEESTIGQLLLHVKSMTINGYLRILTKDIVDVNAKVKKIYPGNKLVVATDIFGGIFAINNCDFDEEKDTIWYFAPDTLQWEDLNIDYTNFIKWALSDNLVKFYSSFLWKSSEDIIQQLNDGDAVLIYPFLWSNECDIETATKKIVPYIELVELNAQYQNSIIES